MADTGTTILNLPATVALNDTDVLPLARPSGTTAPGSDLGMSGAALKAIITALAAKGGLFRGSFAANAVYGQYDGIIIPAGAPSAGLFAFATVAFTAAAAYSPANWTLDPGQSTNDYTTTEKTKLATLTPAAPLYTATGQSAIGSMTQKATSDALAAINNASAYVRISSPAYYTSDYTSTLAGFATLQAALAAADAENIAAGSTGVSYTGAIYVTRASASQIASATVGTFFNMIGDAGDALTVQVMAGVRLRVRSALRLRFPTTAATPLVLTTQEPATIRLESVTVGALEIETFTGTARSVTLLNAAVVLWTNPNGFPVSVILQGTTTIPAAPYPTGITVIDQRAVKYPQLGAGFTVDLVTGIVSTAGATPATASTAGVVKIGSGVSVTADGTISVAAGTGGSDPRKDLASFNGARTNTLVFEGKYAFSNPLLGPNCQTFQAQVIKASTAPATAAAPIRTGTPAQIITAINTDFAALAPADLVLVYVRFITAPVTATDEAHLIVSANPA